MNTLILSRPGSGTVNSLIHGFNAISTQVITLRASSPDLELIIENANSTSSKNKIALVVDFDNADFTEKMIQSLAETLKNQKLFGQSIDNFSTVVFIASPKEDLDISGVNFTNNDLQVINADKIEPLLGISFDVFESRPEILNKVLISIALSSLMQTADGGKHLPTIKFKEGLTAEDKLESIMLNGKILESAKYRVSINHEDSSFYIKGGALFRLVDIDAIARKNLAINDTSLLMNEAVSAKYFREVERLAKDRYTPITDIEKTGLLKNIENENFTIKIDDPIKRRSQLSCDLGL